MAGTGQSSDQNAAAIAAAIGGQRGIKFAPGDKLGRFTLQEAIGESVFGAIYRATDPDVGRDVALRLLRAGALSEAATHRLLRQAHWTRRIRHPNIVSTYESGRIHNTGFVACELTPCKSLRDEVRGGRTFSPAQAARFVAVLANALDYAHRHDIVHRNVNPDNIFVDADSQPLIAELGLLPEIDGAADGESRRLGSPAYMSPESYDLTDKANKKKVEIGPATDIWSLGVVFYELLTGSRPFRGNATEMEHAIRTQEPVAPRKVDDAIPRGLEAICLTCLHKDPKRRFSSAERLAEELDRWLIGEQLDLRPKPPGRGERRTVLVAIALGILGVLFGIGSLEYYALVLRPQWEARASAVEEQLLRLEGEKAQQISDRDAAIARAEAAKKELDEMHDRAEQDKQRERLRYQQLLQQLEQLRERLSKNPPAASAAPERPGADTTPEN